MKADLHAAGIKFRLLYPCKLHLSFMGSALTFDNPNEAADFIRKEVKPAQSETNAEVPAATRSDQGD